MARGSSGAAVLAAPNWALAGMTGTAKTEESEFEKIYKLEVTIIPTNRPTGRQDLSDVVYKTEAAKWKAIAQECAEFHEVGLKMIAAQGGIFGWVAPSEALLAVLGASDATTNPPMTTEAPASEE